MAFSAILTDTFALLYEKVVGKRLSDALQEKIERKNKARRDNYEALERQEKTSFNELVKLYEDEGDGKEYMLQFIPAYKKHFGELKLSQNKKGAAPVMQPLVITGSGAWI